MSKDEQKPQTKRQARVVRKTNQPVSPEATIEATPLSERLFPKTAGVIVPVELVKDYAAYQRDNLSRLFFKIRTGFDDFKTYLKVKKYYDVEYVENPKEGEPTARLIPKETDKES